MDIAIMKMQIMHSSPHCIGPNNLITIGLGSKLGDRICLCSPL